MNVEPYDEDQGTGDLRYVQVTMQLCTENMNFVLFVCVGML